MYDVNVHYSSPLIPTLQIVPNSATHLYQSNPASINSSLSIPIGTTPTTTLDYSVARSVPNGFTSRGTSDVLAGFRDDKLDEELKFKSVPNTPQDTSVLVKQYRKKSLRVAKIVDSDEEDEEDKLGKDDLSKKEPWQKALMVGSGEGKEGNKISDSAHEESSEGIVVKSGQAKGGKNSKKKKNRDGTHNTVVATPTFNNPLCKGVDGNYR